jgi:hypothetical protein
MPEEAEGRRVGVDKNFHRTVPPSQFVRNRVVCQLQNSTEVTMHRLKNC